MVASYIHRSTDFLPPLFMNAVNIGLAYWLSMWRIERFGDLVKLVLYNIHVHFCSENNSTKALHSKL